MLDIPMLEGLTFKYVYDDIGDLDVSKLVSPFIQYSTDYETQGKTFIVDRIRAPCLEENDILLTPERAK
jgi:hypothetical protein